MYDLVQYCEIKKEDYSQGTGYPKGKENEFRERYNKGYWKIKKVTDISVFVVSSETNAILKELRDRPRPNWDENPIFDIYEQDYNYQN